MQYFSRAGFAFECQLLRVQDKRYRAKGGSRDSRGWIKNAASIDEIPEIVEEKNLVIAWEIDTVIGKNHKKVFVGIIERKGKITVTKKYP